MHRRTFLAASAASLALPSIARAQGSRVLKFIPQSDVTVLDPIWTTAYVTRNHGFMIFDTLYGIDNTYTAQPQMVDGHTRRERRQAVEAHVARRADMARRGEGAGARLRRLASSAGASATRSARR